MIPLVIFKKIKPLIDKESMQFVICLSGELTNSERHALFKRLGRSKGGTNGGTKLSETKYERFFFFNYKFRSC